MRNLLIEIAAIVMMVGTCYVPPWDMPDDAVYPGESLAVEESIEEDIIVEETAENEASEDMEFLGYFDMTAYEWTGNPCADGNYPTEGYTVACNSLPLGTEVYIEGVGYRVVEDRGAEWHSYNWMDLYLGDVASCYEWGVRTVAVWVVR